MSSKLKAFSWLTVHSIFGLGPLLIAIFVSHEFTFEILDESIGCFFAATVLAVTFADYMLSPVIPNNDAYLFGLSLSTTAIFGLAAYYLLDKHSNPGYNPEPNLFFQAVCFALAMFLSFVTKDYMFEIEEQHSTHANPQTF